MLIHLDAIVGTVDDEVITGADLFLRCNTAQSQREYGQDTKRSHRRVSLGPIAGGGQIPDGATRRIAVDVKQDVTAKPLIT